MRLAELYKSIQGEGSLAGSPSVFVRVSGCNLRCCFCDTPFASWAPQGDDFSVEEIVAEVELLEANHVVITGGEPMLFAEMIPLCQQLSKRGKHITIETAGTLYLPVDCDLMSISPKLSNSVPVREQFPKWSERHVRTSHRPDVIRRLTMEHPYQIKFVIDSPQDCEEVAEYLQESPAIDRQFVWMMPQGTERSQLDAISAWLEPYCASQGLQFCQRKHIEWFGMARGT